MFSEKDLKIKFYKLIIKKVMLLNKDKYKQKWILKNIKNNRKNNSKIAIWKKLNCRKLSNKNNKKKDIKWNY